MSKGAKSTIVLGAVCLAWFVFMLYFRAFVYADMYKAPDDPYGISDILEFFMGLVFLVILLVNVLASIVLMFRGVKQTKKYAAGLILFSVVLFFTYSPLHSFAARWGS